MQIHGFVPAILDISIKSNISQSEYITLLSEMEIKPGTWKATNDFNEFTRIIKKLSGDDLDNIIKNESHQIHIGSSVAASFTAFNPKLNKYLLILNLFIGNQNFVSKIFFNKIRHLKLNYKIITCAGNIDLCVTSFNKNTPERTMFLYKSIFPLQPIPLDEYYDTFIFISAFEIERNFFNFKVNDLAANNIKFIICLGDKKILYEATKTIIFNLLYKSLIKYIFGNIEEFREILSTNDYQVIDVIEEIKKRFNKLTTLFIVTAGSKGMYVIKEGTIYFEPSNEIIGLVNTNGAGDAAAGGFLSTHILEGDISEALKFAVYQAEKVLRMDHGIITEKKD